MALVFSTATAQTRRPRRAQARDVPVKVRASKNCAKIAQEIVEAFAKQLPDTKKPFDVAADSHASIAWFADHNCDVLAYDGLPSPATKSLLTRLFPSKSQQHQPQTFFVGQERLVVVVHPTNPVKKLHADQLRQLLGRKGGGMKWPQLGGKGGSAQCFLEGAKSRGRAVLRDTCMRYRSKVKGVAYSGWYAFRQDLKALPDGNAVLRRVRETPDGIGFLLYQGGELPGVRPLAVAESPNGPFVQPKIGLFVQKDYPLAKSVVFYLHPDALPLARALCQFATGPDGAKVAAAGGVISPFYHAQAEAAARMKAAADGKVPVLRLSGTPETRALIQALATACVKTVAAVQLDYAPSPAAAAVDAFCEGTRNVLVLTERPDKNLSPERAKQWKAMKPTPRTLAASGLQVFVNIGTRATGLTSQRVREVFDGTVKDWETFYRVTEHYRGKRRPLILYGPKAPPGLTRLFHDKVAPAENAAKAKKMATSDEVLQALAGDLRGIAYATPRTLAPSDPLARKIRALTVDGIPCTPETMHDGTYPFSQRLTVYVSPKATEAEKAFVDFILAGACDSLVRSRGLTPPPR